MKYFILLFIFTTSAFSLSINESLLKVHAILVPKIYLMDYEFKEKLHDDSIIIALFYDNRSYKGAVSLKNKIDKKYKNGIKECNVKVKLVSYNEMASIEANIYYLFPTNTNNIKYVIKQANDNKALTFSYQKDDLKYGVMLSLKVGNKIKPIINISAIKSNKITFRPILLEISKIYINTKEGMLNFNIINLSNSSVLLALLPKNTFMV